MLEALVALSLLVAMIAGLVSVARDRREAQSAQAAVDAAAWSAAAGSGVRSEQGIRVRSEGPWRIAEDSMGHTSRRVPAW